MPEALRDRSASGTDGVLERAVERLHRFSVVIRNSTNWFQEKAIGEILENAI
jgi:TolB-like protein